MVNPRDPAGNAEEKQEEDEAGEMTGAQTCQP